MSEVYYLKYRPQKIKELDLEAVRERLSQLLSAKSIPHALLFSGPKGLGKTSAARIIAKAINCLNKGQSIEPCNKCTICQSITKGTSLDLIEIDAASNRGIDDIRELRERIKLAPSQAKKKVYVIDEVHMLTKEAFNALLKTLEEPPEHAFFILCTTEPHKLPETIISRCQDFEFHLARPEEIVRSLKRIVKGEKLKIDDKALLLISQKADGNFRDAAKILQQLAFTGKVISLKRTVDALEKEVNLSKEILRCLAEKDTPQALARLNQAVNKGVDLKILIQTILEDLRQVLLVKYGMGEKEDYGLPIEAIKELIYLFDQAGRELKGAVVPQLPLELAIINFKIKNQKSKIKNTYKNSKLKDNKKILTTNNQDDLKKWQQVLEVVKQDNHSVEALLKSTRFKEVKKDKIIIEVFYEFHKNKLESDENVELVEKKIREVFGRKLKVEYRLRG